MNDDENDQSIVDFVNNINANYEQQCKKKIKFMKNKKKNAYKWKNIEEIIKKDDNNTFTYKFIKFIINNFCDPIIIVLLYIILSQNFIKIFIGKYIKEINPSNNNNVSLIGVIIYGSILALFFVIIKKYITTLSK